MIELIEALPDGVVGLVAVGRVSADDYAAVANPAIERALAGRRRIRLIHVLGERFDGYTAGGTLADAWLGLAHWRSFERVAVVTDLQHVRRLVRGAGWSVPGEMRLFSTAEEADALSWIAEDLPGETGG